MTVESKRFRVALSFPGERREFVEQVADALSDRLGRDKVLYDRYYVAEFARPDLDTYLQRLYHEESDLIAAFLCADYDKKEWCGLEWRAIRDLIKGKNNESVMPLRFDDTTIPGLFSIDGYVWLPGMEASQVAELILSRLNQGEQKMVPVAVLVSASNNQSPKFPEELLIAEKAKDKVVAFNGKSIEHTDYDRRIMGIPEVDVRSLQAVKLLQSVKTPGRWAENIRMGEAPKGIRLDFIGKKVVRFEGFFTASSDGFAIGLSFQNQHCTNPSERPFSMTDELAFCLVKHPQKEEVEWSVRWHRCIFQDSIVLPNPTQFEISVKLLRGRARHFVVLATIGGITAPCFEVHEENLSLLKLSSWDNGFDSDFVLDRIQCKVEAK